MSFKVQSAAALAVVTLALSISSRTVCAQEFHRNAWGFYAAPTIYGLTKGSEYQLATSGAGLDMGLFYARAFTPGFSARLEVRYGTRALDDTEWNEFFGAYDLFRLSESIVEFPLVFQGDRRIPISDHALRISAGGGVSYKYVLEQKLIGGQSVEFTGKPGELTPADSYQKLGLLLDGGVTFDLDRRSAVFARLRLDVDVSTFGEPSDADVIRRFWATGLYVGWEAGL